MADGSWFFHWSSTKTLFVLGLLVVSGFASSSETAFFSLNRFQLRRIKERYPVAHARIRTLLGRPSRLLIMILVLNELVNITLSNVITRSIQGPSSWYATTALSMAITIPLLILFGEITPKLIAAKMNHLVAIGSSKPLMLLYKILFPMLWIMDTAIGTILRRFKAEGRDHLSKTMSVLSEEDVMLIAEEGHREGTVEPAERKMIQNVFEFDDSTIDEVMTPISQAFSVSALAKLSEVLPDLRTQKYSRVPVYQKSRKNIVGILYLKDLLPLRSQPQLKELEVRSLMTSAMHVSPKTRLSVLFRRFKDAKTHMAIVGDSEYAQGVVTMEDLLESIFGEIADERDIT